MRAYVRPMIATIAIAGALSLSGCSQLSSACTSVDETMAAVETAVGQAVAAADAGDLAGASAALDGARGAVTSLQDGAQQPALSGIVGGLSDGLNGITQGIDTADGTVAATSEKIAQVQRQLHSAQEFVTSKREAIQSVCSAG